MTIQKIRILSVFILLLIIVSNQYQILYYFPIMLISLEYLNRNKDFITNYNFKILNAIFIGYVIFICLDRARSFQITVAIELIINSIEHILFGFIISLKASIYYSILKQKFNLKQQQLIWIAIVFNIFGLFNEFFQNWYKHQSLWQLNFDSKKDIIMNIIGSLIFIFLYQKININIRNKIIKS